MNLPQPTSAWDNLPEHFVEASCVDCGTVFSAKRFIVPGLDRALGRTVCLPCVEARELAAERAKVREREELWHRLCPTVYQACDPSQLPSNASRAVFRKALAWGPGANGRGLGIVGRQSGQGKTRILFAAARGHFLAGAGLRAVNCGTLGTDISASVGTALRELLRPLRRVGLLLLDDLGKERATPHVAAAFYSLVEERTARGLPILFSANFGGDELADKLGEHGPFIVRRLREFSDTHILN